MVQIVPYKGPSLGEIGESFKGAWNIYNQNKLENEKLQELSILNQRPPENASDEEKQALRNRQSFALAKHGTIQDMLKHNKQILLEDELSNFNKKYTQPKVATNDTLVSDEDVGGQANEDPLQVIEKSGPETLAPTQVPTGKKPVAMTQPEENLEEKLNDINRIGALNPTAGNQLLKTESILSKNAQSKAAMDQRERLATQKLNAQESSKNKEHLVEAQKESFDRLKTSEDSIFALQNQLEAVNRGDIGVWSKANLSDMLSAAGYPKLSAAAQTEGGALFNTAKKQLFAGAKNIFGAKVSNFEAAFFDTMQAATGRSKEANRAAIFSLMLPQLVSKEQDEYRLKLIDENPEIDALKLNGEVGKHMVAYKDRLFDQWKNYIQSATKSKHKNTPLSKTSAENTEKAAPEAKKETRKPLSEIFK